VAFINTVNSNLLNDMGGNSLLAEKYKEQEGRWDSFIEKYYANSEILRWGTNHRVYRNNKRAIKVEWKEGVSADKKLRLEYEYEILKSIEGKASTLNPNYKCIDGDWHVIEMDFLDGESLEDLILQGKASKVSIYTLFKKIFLISCAGVFYKQFRARHIFQSANGDIGFVDFGHSVFTSPLIALYKNISLVSINNWSIKAGRFMSIVIEILRNKKNIAANMEKLRNQKALTSYSRKSLRPKSALPEGLNTNPGDRIAAKHISKLEGSLVKAIQENKKAALDTFQYQLCGYGMTGYRDWGCVWDFIRRNIDFSGKRILDLGCGIGAVAAFSRLERSKNVLSIDNDKHLLSAAKNYSLAFGVSDNTYQYFDWIKENVESELHYEADIVTALSFRLEEIQEDNLIEFLTQYPEIIWQIKNIKIVENRLRDKGYKYFKVLTRSQSNRYIIYAK
jgi:SAM-dependent methyltransferase/predicted Ser/Thr protein kinase